MVGTGVTNAVRGSRFGYVLAAAGTGRCRWRDGDGSSHGSTVAVRCRGGGMRVGSWEGSWHRGDPHRAAVFGGGGVELTVNMELGGRQWWVAVLFLCIATGEEDREISGHGVELARGRDSLWAHPDLARQRGTTASCSARCAAARWCTCAGEKRGDGRGRRKWRRWARVVGPGRG